MASGSGENEECDFKTLAERNFHKMHEKATKMGYVDGIEAGKESVFQQSFDIGYADGFRTGLEFEKFKSFSETILKRRQQEDDNLVIEAKILQNNIDIEVTDAKHCQYKVHANENWLKVSAEQSKYVDDKLTEWTTIAPHTAALFNKK